MQSSAVLLQTIGPARNYHQDWLDNSNTAIHVESPAHLAQLRSQILNGGEIIQTGSQSCPDDACGKRTTLAGL